MAFPLIIQGGMGVGVSNWRLAKAVSTTGHLGVVSGTALDTILARRLQMGDTGGHMRRALAQFPDAAMAQRVLDRYFMPGGHTEPRPFRQTGLITLNMDQETRELTVVANFVEVYLARQGHANPVGINLMEKIQLPNLVALYGAMLAGVDYVTMGAGIPREIPGVLDSLAAHEPVSLKISVEARNGNQYRTGFNPGDFWHTKLPTLKRPKFLSIISSVLLAKMMAKKATGRVDGFVVEMPSAGGHNAPPRGKLALNEGGEPIYGARDAVEIDEIRAIGLPFWLAGNWGTPAKLREAVSLGASGVQIGTLLAFADESGFTGRIKQQAIGHIHNQTASVFTDPAASPTGFPFKVLSLDGTLSEADAYRNRDRTCDLGYLRQLYETPEGRIGYRCPAEPAAAFLAKGGRPEDLKGKKCLCNALLSNIGLGQVRKNGYMESALVTSGDGIQAIRRFLGTRRSYSTADAIAWIQS